jgi:membrane-bound lytic murein transglycosylase A
MAGALDGRGLEIAWADDPLALFLLQVQGSGRLRFPDRVQPVRFAGTNGRPYRALGAEMIAHGLLGKDEADIPGIRRVFATLPEDRQLALLATNPRYGFFQPADGDPVGSLGVPLTPGRSIAADPALLPPGSLALLVTPRVTRFVVVQDTGAAIVGPHVDLFVGAGPEAEAFAGSARDRGTLYLLAPATR